MYDLEDGREGCYAGVCSVIFCACYEASSFIVLFKTVAGKEILLWPHEAWYMYRKVLPCPRLLSLLTVRFCACQLVLP